MTRILLAGVLGLGAVMVVSAAIILLAPYIAAAAIVTLVIWWNLPRSDGSLNDGGSGASLPTNPPKPLE